MDPLLWCHWAAHKCLQYFPVKLNLVQVQVGGCNVTVYDFKFSSEIVGASVLLYMLVQ